MTMPPAAPELFESGSTKGIKISTWTVSSTKMPILNAQECDDAAAELHLPLPEICFGNNRLALQDARTGLCLEWDTLAALHHISHDTPIKVAHAAEWARGQASGSSSDVTVQKPYDWTYTTTHPGSISISSPSSSSDPPQPRPPTFVPAPSNYPGIPLHLLARQDIPILFYDEIPLFEDELGDNGIAELVVRVRVNSSSIFVLSRFFLRIDNVLFRIFDVRVYHDFTTNEIIRDQKGRQAPYDQVKKRLPADKSDDLTPLTDVNWVAQQLEMLATSPPSAASSPPTSAPPARFTLGRPNVSESLSRLHLNPDAEGKADSLPQWDAEGRRLEVLTLPPR